MICYVKNCTNEATCCRDKEGAHWYCNKHYEEVFRGSKRIGKDIDVTTKQPTGESEERGELREEISKILVKWGMPTRQVAINEIISLVEIFQAKI